ncbi:hypothetical protein DF147_35665 [Burkholderia cenocepacia]|nr:hypothetical protein DF147_35665 [Burkholderia cenocepacia]RQV79235.1 hypothetical protein DF019_35135 [Burkholderia cenocepacia]
MTTKYTFNIPSLEVGDVLLSRGEGAGASLIAKHTDGHFSHAMVNVGNSVIHAMPDGVYSKNPQRLLFDSIDDIQVLRVRGGLTSQQKVNIERIARAWVGALYSKWEAIAVVAKTLRKTNSSQKQFCSRLVAQCYQEAGIQIVPNADYCSPNDLVLSPMLHAVPDSIVEASETEIKFANEKVDYNIMIQRCTFTWLAKARALARRRGLGDIARQSDVGKLIGENPSLDKVICNYIRSSGYLNYVDVDRDINPFRYNKTLFLEKFPTEPELKHAIAVERDVNATEITRHGYNYNVARHNLDVLNNEYHRLVFLHTANLLREVQVRVGVLNEVENTLDGE